MKQLRFFCLIALACLAGLFGGELICRRPGLRDWAGCKLGRGHLIAIANGRGLYANDLEDREGMSARDWIATENLRRTSAEERIDSALIDREIALIRAEFRDEAAFAEALHSQDLSVDSLREIAADHIRSLQWLEKKIAPETLVAERECRDFYETHRELFLQPMRFRASHLFLAAHAETPTEVVEAKSKAIQELSRRLSRGEDFSKLVAEVSEDEATKTRGGDLDFFSAIRMPSEFFAEVEKLRPGETSEPFRSHLGFHLIRLTDRKAPHLLEFQEARPEILLAIVNQRRASIANRFADDLAGFAQFRPSF